MAAGSRDSSVLAGARAHVSFDVSQGCQDPHGVLDGDQRQRLLMAGGVLQEQPHPQGVSYSTLPGRTYYSNACLQYFTAWTPAVHACIVFRIAAAARGF